MFNGGLRLFFYLQYVSLSTSQEKAPDNCAFRLIMRKRTSGFTLGANVSCVTRYRCGVNMNNCYEI